MLNVTALHAKNANIYKYLYTNTHIMDTCKYIYFLHPIHARRQGPTRKQYTRIRIHVHKKLKSWIHVNTCKFYFQSMLNVTALHVNNANVYKYVYTYKHICVYM